MLNNNNLNDNLLYNIYYYYIKTCFIESVKPLLKNEYKIKLKNKINFWVFLSRETYIKNTLSKFIFNLWIEARRN